MPSKPATDTFPVVPGDVPLIYSPTFAPARVSPPGRLLTMLIAGGCLTVLILAARVTPNPNGMGTHQRLGLQQCQFLVRTGLPCPSCGMTTSFAHFVRGHLATSFCVQPAGFVLAILTTMLFWACLYIAITGKPVHRMIQMIHMRTHTLLFTFFGIGLFGWAWKIFVHLNV